MTTYYAYEFGPDDGVSKTFNVSLGGIYPADTTVRMAVYYNTSTDGGYIEDLEGVGSSNDGLVDEVIGRKATPYYTLTSAKSSVSATIFSGPLVEQYVKQYVYCTVEVIPPGLAPIVFDIDFAFTLSSGQLAAPNTIGVGEFVDLNSEFFNEYEVRFDIPVVPGLVIGAEPSPDSRNDTTISTNADGPWKSVLEDLSRGDIIYIKTQTGSEYSTNYYGTVQVYVIVDSDAFGGGQRFNDSYQIIRYRTIPAPAEPGPVTPTSPNYNISASKTSILEGGSVTFTINTANVSDGTTLYWSLSGTGIAAEDFTSDSLTGSVIINGNSASVTLTTTEDAASEGSESFLLELREGSVAGSILTQSLPVTITEEDPIQRYPDDGQIGHHLASNSAVFRFGEEWYKITGTPISL